MAFPIRSAKDLIKRKRPFSSPKLIICMVSVLAILVLLHIHDSRLSHPSHASLGAIKNQKTQQNDTISLISKLRDSVTFLPLKDLRFAKTAVMGNTWFMSSFNDTGEANESKHLYFPSEQSKGRLLCIKGHDRRDGTKNSYALAWPESLPHSTTLLKGLTFVSDTYYDYGNLWHGLGAIAPFVGWSIKNECAKPDRWLLFHWGEIRDRMGLWLRNITQATFGDVPIEVLTKGDDEGPHCFEKAVVMRHCLGRTGWEKLRVSDLLRCRVRAFCGLRPPDRGTEVDAKGEHIVRLTLLMRRNTRSFMDPEAVIRVFERECSAVAGCIMVVAQSEDLSFCDQVKIMTNTDVVASPHGAQLTNMLFMNRNSSIMEFFPKGWLELAGVGKHAHRWMAALSGMNHTGAWYDPLGKRECPNPHQDQDCFKFYKGRKIGHNETYFAEWARAVLSETRARKIAQATQSSDSDPNTCAC